MSPTRPRSAASTSKPSAAKTTASKAATGGGAGGGWGKPPAPRKDRRVPFLLLVILLLLLAFWLGRCTNPPAPAQVLPAAPVIAPAPSTALAPVAHTAPAPTPATTPAKPAASAPASASVTITAVAPPRPKTALLEVSVGTSGRGGIALLFDHQVTWTVDNQSGGGHAEIQVAGVEAMSSFPRNLPLPPGVAAIHAVLKAETLTLKFELKPGILAYTAPANGPATALNVYFRTPIEEASTGAGMQGGAGSAPASGASATGCGADTGKVVALLQQSLAKNPAYAEVREALAVLMTCAGNSAMAQQLMDAGLKTGGSNTVHTVVLEAALLYGRGDAAGAVQLLKAHAPIKVLDHGYFELLTDFENAAK